MAESIVMKLERIEKHLRLLEENQLGLIQSFCALSNLIQMICNLQAGHLKNNR